MNNVKDLTDFYMWMVDNDFDHNIRLRVEKKAEIYNSKRQHRDNCKPPTAFEKNNLPIEIRYSYCKTIELYQKIQLYEMGLINKTDFINETKAIEDYYSNLE